MVEKTAKITPGSPPWPSSEPGASQLFWPWRSREPVSRSRKSSRAIRRSRAGERARSRRRWARRASPLHSAALDATLLWFCVPDREIRGAASGLASRLAARALVQKKGKVQDKVRFAFHSSGALSSRELEPLRKAGVAVASVHPLMTFVVGAHPTLTGVPFAIEGDDAATRVARRIVRELGGESFLITCGA